MHRKLTITIDEEVYLGLHKVIGPRKISRFIEDLARPHVVKHQLEAAYQEMSKDRAREKAAIAWAEVTVGDSGLEER